MADAIPVCAVCCEALGKFGGPVTLPCGHNGCLQCMAHVQRAKPECPLCRATFSATQPLVVNHELRDLVKLTSTLHTVDGTDDGWQTLAAVKPKGKAGKKMDGEVEGDVALVPSAPPLHCDLETVLEGEGDLLSLEPPTWVPDSHAGDCSACHEAFRPFTRLRHHCRLCGLIFCDACCRLRAMLPPKFQLKEPQRVCTTCAQLLEPLQPFLAGTISQAVQPAVHDVTDVTCAQSWFNSPLTTSLTADIYKATNIVRAFRAVGKVQPETGIPAAVLRGAAGFAILSIAKMGLGYSVGMGTGLIVARRESDDSWSPPSAIAALSAGWGLQMGGELTDLLIVLRTKAAVVAFCSTLQAGVGGGVSVAVGPMGRSADAALRMGRKGAALCYSYSLSRGAFIGVSIEGTMMSVREGVNLQFYGRAMPARALLLDDAVPPPAAASALYAALDALMDWASSLPAPAGFLTTRDIAARDSRAVGLLDGAAAEVHRRGRDAVRRAVSAVSGRRSSGESAQDGSGTPRRIGSGPRRISQRSAGHGSALDRRDSPPEAIASPSPPPTRPRSFPVSPAHYYEAAATPGLARALDAEDGSFTIAGARTSAPLVADIAGDSGLPDSGMFALFSD